MKRTNSWLVSLLVLLVFGLVLVACGQEPETVEIEVTRVVEVPVVETVEVTRIVEIEVEVPVTPEPSQAQLAAEKFAETIGRGEDEAYEILSGTHPTITYLLVEGGMSPVETEGIASGVGVFCAPDSTTETNYYIPYNSFLNSDETVVIGQVRGWYKVQSSQIIIEETVQEVEGTYTAWVWGQELEFNSNNEQLNLNDIPQVESRQSNLPSCTGENDVANQVGFWESAELLWGSLPRGGEVYCVSWPNMSDSDTTVVEIFCPSLDTSLEFYFEGQAPDEIRFEAERDEPGFVLQWVFEPGEHYLGDVLVVSEENQRRIDFYFADLEPNTLWLAGDSDE